MKIFNIRHGFATNSSSSHSIVRLRSGKKMSRAINTPNDDKYGWKWFILKTREEKLKYFAVQFKDYIGKRGPFQEITSLFEGVEINKDSYVDHESSLNLKDVAKDKHWKAFVIQAVKHIIDNDELFVIGGNDNNDLPKEYERAYDRVDFSYILFHQNNFRVVHNKEHNFFSVCDKYGGSKYRFSFVDLSKTPTKSDAPELVDVKITNKCNSNCKFCYMNSHKEGNHASFENIKSVIDSLHEIGTFEIALGGGEPTQHPDFIKIVEYIKNIGMICNYSSKNYSLSPGKFKKIVKNIGGFAFSVSNKEEIDKAISAINLYKDSDIYFSCSFQVVAGIISKEDMEYLFKNANVPGMSSYDITILGYKKNGRGCDVVCDDSYKEWLFPMMKTYNDVNVSFDTVMCWNFGEETLKANGVDPIHYSMAEGKFSCFVDAVEMKIGPSSFCESEKMLKIAKCNSKEIARLYQTF